MTTETTQQGGDAAAQAAAAAAAQQASDATKAAAADKAAAAAAAQQTPEQKAAADKAAADKAAADAANKGKAPEKYEAFKLPEGVTFSPELQTGIETFARDAKLDQGGAQKLADFAATQLQALNAQAQKVRADWKAAAEKDPEIGGDKLPKALGDAAAVIDAFAGQNATEFKQYLNTSGLGNHPELIRIFARIRAGMSEDKFVTGGKKPAPSDARTLFPNSNMNP